MNNINDEKIILIVDDSDVDRKVLINTLKSKGNYKIIEASSTKDGLKQIETNKIDLVLLDLLIGNEDGNNLLVKIREKFNEIELPVIITTAINQESDIIRSLELRANDYLSKPINLNIALTRINTQLKLSKISKEMNEVSKKMTLNAVVVTYNHQINNELTIAMSKLNKYFLDKDKNESPLKELSESLWNISDIVKKIKASKDNILLEKYSTNSVMIKIDKKTG